MHIHDNSALGSQSAEELDDNINNISTYTHIRNRASG